MEKFIARQPIFDNRLRVVAYELLFRSDLDNYCKVTDADRASSAVISDSLLLFDIRQLTDGRGAFINLSRDALLRDYGSLLPKDLVTIELLESVEPDDAAIEAFARLKRVGYRLALDDFVERPGMQPLLDMADCVKIDVLACQADSRPALISRLRRGRPTLQLLAEKVETPEVFAECTRQGFNLFQGYFFARPTIMSSRDVPGSKLHYLQLLREISDAPYDLTRVEQVLREDVGMSYKLLRYLHSADFGLRNRVSSIREGLILLGQDNIRKLASLWALTGLGKGGSEEVLVTSIARARFCEALAVLAGLPARQAEAFLLGMFSLIDVVIGRPMSAIVEQLPVADDVRAGLVDASGGLRPILDCVVAYERADWDGVSAFARAHGVDEAAIPKLYVEAITHAAGLRDGPAPARR